MVQAFAADRWDAFSDPYPVHDATAFGSDGVMLATEGGIRYCTRDGDLVYHSQHGLETSSFFSIVSSPRGTFAVSEFGMVVALNNGASGWRVLSRSYVSNNVRARSGGAVLGENILVIAFEDRLAFFDVEKSVSLLTLERIGAYSFQMNPLKQLAVHGDTLLVNTEKGAYSRVMDWKNLASDVRLSDPGSWNPLPSPNGIDEFKSLDTMKLVVGGEDLTKRFQDPSGKSLVKWVVSLSDGDFLIGSYGVWYRNSEGDIKEVLYDRYRLGEVYEVRATPQGGVMAASVDGRLALGNLGGWFEPTVVLDGLGNDASAYSSRMKVLATLPDGKVFYHVWGWVYQIYSEWGRELEYSFKPDEGHCFDNYLTNYPISAFAVTAPDNSGFLTATADSNGYSIVYFTKDGDVHCAKHVGKKANPGPMYVKVDEDGSWVIYVSSKKGTALANTGGLDRIRVPAPKSNGGELHGTLDSSYYGITPAPIDMVFDSVSDRLWMVSMSNIAYLDEEQDSLIVPSSTNGLRGVEYTSIDVDVHGNLWVGTTSHGVYRLSMKKNSPDTLSVQHFTSRDGLLSDNVSDVAIDGVNGVAWFAHERGVSLYLRNDLKDSRKNMTDSAAVPFRAYPVPFRPKEHSFFVIEGFTEDAVVSIYNRGGALIRTFKNGDVAGGRLEWNGRDKSGGLVAPGVYYYVVNKARKTKKGKFIVVH